MNRTPYFSVCVPCFNHARYVGKTVESVLAQDFQDFEIVVADNASTDDSRSVVRSFQDPRVRLIENRYNIGFAPNLQRVTEHARGKFMILLSSDDLMRPGALKRYQELFSAQGARAEESVIFSATDVIDDRGETMGVKVKRQGEVGLTTIPLEEASRWQFDGSVEIARGKEVLRNSLVMVQYPGCFCATAYPHALWWKVEGYDTTYQYMPDAVFLDKLLALDSDYIYVNERLFAYRVHSANQNAQAAAQGALRKQVDGYMRAVNYPQRVLDSVGLSRAEIVRGFIDKLCIVESLRAISHGQRLLAFKLLSFGFATYPAVIFRRPRAYLGLMLLALGPIGTAAGKLARALKRSDLVPKQIRSSMWNSRW